MTTITCTKCYKSLDQSLFINKKGDFYNVALLAENKIMNILAKEKKTDENVSILSYKELDQYLTEMINNIGQEKDLENC